MVSKSKDSIDKLTVKQECFCNFYIEDEGNASAAYRRAYSCERMMDKTVNERSSRLLKEYKISTRIKELQAELQKRSDITKDEAVKELANMVRANVMDYVEVEDIMALDEKNKPFIAGQHIKIKDLSALTVEQQRCIKSIAPTRSGIKIELCDKVSVIDRLSKMLGWDETTKLSIEENINQVTVFELPNNGRGKDK